jgi:hypothetical protein
MKASFSDGRLIAQFDTKPDRRTINALKGAGFWWDGRAGCWWLARPQAFKIVGGRVHFVDGRAEALNVLRALGMTDAEAEAINRADEAHAHRVGARGMEIACGIG